MNKEIEANIAAAQKWCEEKIETVHMPVLSNEEKTYVECGSIMVGSQMEEARQRDKELQEAMKTNETAEEAFKKAPLNGCLSVMTMARTKAGFVPTDIDDTEGQKKFMQYSKNLQSAPFFHLEMSDVSHVEHKESSWKGIIDKIVDLYEGISAEDKNKIANSIAALADAATSKAGTSQTKNLFIQSTIDYGHEIEVYVYWSNISMVYESGKSTSKQSTIDITKMLLQFDKDMWPYYAGMVLKYNVSFIEEWLKQNSVETKESIKRICFYRKS